MQNAKTTQIALALIISSSAIFVFKPSKAEERAQALMRFQITVVDVIDAEDTVVKQLRIDAMAESHVKITADTKGGGSLSSSVGSANSDAKKGFVAVTVFADHVEWKAGDVNALKFMMSIDGNGSKVLMSDTGPMVIEKQLSDLLSVPLKSGRYEYGTAIPIVKFKDTTFSLTVASPALNP